MSAFPPLSLLPERPTAATVLADLRAQKHGLALALGNEAPPEPISDRADAFDALVFFGALVELSALPGAGAHTLAFLVLREAQRRAAAAGRPAWLCAVDPSRTLSAPAVAALGVDLTRMLVLQPPRERLLRTAARAQRSGVLCATVIDATGEGDLGALDGGLRRLARAAEQGGGAVVVLTSSRARRGLPVPAAARALVERAPGDELHVRFLRHRHGALPRLVLPAGS
ncbi:MAG: hypothetical protein HYS27_00235 [Deltaproteobacteria bacterium]|nr:hypothetical protein [Deltaproteobacteria bacterium]